MSNDKQKLEEVLIELVAADAQPWERKKLINEAIEKIGYTKAELADHSCESLSSRLKSLTGVVINELCASNVFSVDDDRRICRAVVPLSQLECKEYFCKKYLSDEEQKNKRPEGKRNVLLAILGQVWKRKSEDGSIEREGIAVMPLIEEELLKNERFRKDLLSQKEKYPNTPIGKKLKYADELFNKCRDRKMKPKDYELALKKTVIECINFAGGEFFERLSMLLLKDCYGSSVEKDELTGGPEDNGIDGKLYVRDGLGFQDVIFFQSKTKLNSRAYVSIKVIRELIGVTLAYEATKGILITNSNFTVESRKFAAKVKNIMLIDGARLFELMVQYERGIVKSGDLLKIDDKTFLQE